MLTKLISWHSELSNGMKILLWSVTAVLAGTAMSGASPDQSSSTTSPAPASQVAAFKSASTDATSRIPKVTTKIVTDTEPIPFSKTSKNEPSLDLGKSRISQAGSDGIMTKTYEVTYADDKETSRKLIKEQITTPAVTEITLNGTRKVAAVATPPAPKPAASSSCDPNYSGACVPIASDVDCAGGSGNGPAYVSGPVYVVGVDKYDLDRDGDGVGCQ